MKPSILIAFLFSCFVGILLIAKPQYDFIIIVLAAFCAIASFLVTGLWLLEGKLKLKYTVGFLPFLFVVLFSKAFRYVKKNQAVEVQNQIDGYKTTHKRFPKDLGQLHSIGLKSKFSYKVDSIGQTYELEYDLDNTERLHYDSKSQKWMLFGPFE
jgi:hypothetical protein